MVEANSSATGKRAGAGSSQIAGSSELNGTTTIVRLFGWFILAALVAFLLNNYLSSWRGWPGAEAALLGTAAAAASSFAWVQLIAYPFFMALAAFYVLRSGHRSLRQDSVSITRINTFLIRAAFFAVLYVGLADMVISFMRVEGLLPGVFGDKLAIDLGRPLYRGPVVHMPLIGLAIVTAMLTRTLGFHWLALLIVVAELQIVISRFIFSYEQAFMADIVRFWYAALFLFASAYTLLEEGHVRVDVLYANFSPKKQGLVNAVGSIVLGVSLCWVILAIGMNDKSSIINSPILAFETTQTGFGMYVKYMMAGFLALFAISMMIQFVSYFLDAVADYRQEPGGRDHDVHATQ